MNDVSLVLMFLRFIWVVLIQLGVDSELILF